MIIISVNNSKIKSEILGLISQSNFKNPLVIDNFETIATLDLNESCEYIIDEENFSQLFESKTDSAILSKIQYVIIQKNIAPSSITEVLIKKHKIDKFQILDFNSQLIKRMSQFLDSFPDLFSPINKPDILIPIDFTHFDKFHISPFDIYLKLSDNKYIKIINQDEKFAFKETLEKYENKKVDTFYIKFSMLYKLKTLSTKEKIIQREDENNQNYHLRVSDSALKVARDFGITESMLDNVFVTFDSISKDFNDSQKLKNFLGKLNLMEGTELGKHCYLTSIFITVIGRKVKWFTQEIRKNLFISSILHDLELFELDYSDSEFISISDTQSFSPDRLKAVKGHPTALAKKLSKLDIISSDVIHIIEKHHEGAGNLSYPIGLNGPQLSPPSALFNVAHMFSIFLQNHDYDYDQIDKAIGELKMFYSSTTFKPYIEILEAEIK